MQRTNIQINSSDWARVKTEAGQDAPIAWDEASEPYNPNDAESVTAYWQQSTIRPSVGNTDLKDTLHQPTTRHVSARGLSRNHDHDMSMYSPAHPGEVLAGWLHDLHMDVATFARQHGLSPQCLSRLTRCKTDITIDLDRCLAMALGTTVGFWLSLQIQWDVWTAQMRAKENALKPTVVSSGDMA